MRIAMIGTGYVGLVSGTCFSEFGHEVICVDKDAARSSLLERGEIPIYEPGLDGSWWHATSRPAGCASPPISPGGARRRGGLHRRRHAAARGDGHADLSLRHRRGRARSRRALDGYTVDRHQVDRARSAPAARSREAIRAASPDAEFDVASNPEFLREGAAIDDFMRPDRVVIGTDSARAREVMAELYRPLYLREAPIVFTDLETAELIKYAANAFLATKITFINEIADALRAGRRRRAGRCARGIGLDGRIGSQVPARRARATAARASPRTPWRSSGPGRSTAADAASSRP